MPSNTEKLISFVTREIEYVPAACRFDLYCLVDGLPEKLGVFRVKDGKPTPETVAEIVNEVETTAKSCAESMSVIAKFKLISMFRVKPLMEGGKWRVQKQKTEFFTLAGKLRPVGTAEGTHYEAEPPTPTGLLGQLMRHLEAKEKEQMSLTANVLDYTQRENQRMAVELRELRRKDAEVQAERELLQSNAHEREMQKRKADADEERKNLALNVLMKEVLPLIMQHLPEVFDKLKGASASPALNTEKQAPVSDQAPPASTASSEDDKFKTLKMLFLGIDDETRDEVLKKVMEKDPKRAAAIGQLLFF